MLRTVAALVLFAFPISAAHAQRTGACLPYGPREVFLSGIVQRVAVSSPTIYLLRLDGAACVRGGRGADQRDVNNVREIELEFDGAQPDRTIVGRRVRAVGKLVRTEGQPGRETIVLHVDRLDQ